MKLAQIGITCIVFATIGCGTYPEQDDEIDLTSEESLVAAQAFVAAQAGEVLYDYDLPPGDSGSINVAWWNNGSETNLDPNQWLGMGFDGIRFQGQGVASSHIRCTSWDGITVAVKQHNGVVEFRDLTIHTGHRTAVTLGEQNLAKKISPKFKLRLVNVHVVADSVPTDADRAEWGVFTYQADLHFQNVVFHTAQLHEHGTYAHGFANQGAFLQNVRYVGCGAECFKVRSDSTETAWVGPQAQVIIRNSRFANWFQEWSWRGGAAIVLQGAAANVTIDGALFKPGPAHANATGFQRSKTIMISSEGSSYDIDTGSQTTGHGNGNVTIRNVATSGNVGPTWYSPTIRIGRNGGNQSAAKEFRLENCGMWGQFLSLQISNLDAWGVSGCNTPEITAQAQALGLDTTNEVVYIQGGLHPLSGGRVFGP